MYSLATRFGLLLAVLLLPLSLNSNITPNEHLHESPSNTGVHCTNLQTDGRIATGDCRGTGYVRLVVECYAVWPFPSWSEDGPVTYVADGMILAFAHTYCGGTTNVYYA